MIEHSAWDLMCVNISSRLCIQSTDHVVNRRRQFMIVSLIKFSFKVIEEYSHLKEFI